jgi:nucleoside-diphosphate-sugar epimerase
VTTLVTGATGLVGNAVAVRLAARGDRVRALVRDPERAARSLPPSVERVRGDVTEPASLRAAMAGVERVFHAAGMPEQWQRDEGVFDRVNRQGTANVLEAALAAGVRRVVYTSTMDVFAAPAGGTLVETHVDREPKHTAYERSKQAAEVAAEEIRARGLDVVYVNPSAVYGPSPVHTSLNQAFIRFLNGKVPLTPPGGLPVVYVDGCAEAHLAAMERGVSGERYLLADRHVSFKELLEEIARQAGGRKVPPVAPAWLLKALAAVSAPVARAFKLAPLVAPGELTFLLWNVRCDTTKAQAELGFVPQSFPEGVARTIAFLRAEKLVP